MFFVYLTIFPSFRCHLYLKRLIATVVYGMDTFDFIPYTLYRTNATVMDTRERMGAPVVLGVGPMGGGSAGES